MRERLFNLALETSGRCGSISLGHGDELIQSIELPPPRRHTVDLMPAVDTLCQRHSLAAQQLSEVYISIGPGSFTGLRIGVASVKMLAQVLELKVVAVPTLEVVAQNAPGGDHGLAVCLNLKAASVYAGLFAWNEQVWKLVGEPALMSMEELLGQAPRPLALLGDPLPLLPEAEAAVRGVWVMASELAQARSEALWRLGRQRSREGRFDDPWTLLPLYARVPEAEELWKRRERKQA